MKLDSRRTFLKMSLMGSVLGYGVLAKGAPLPALKPTPPETMGPFYPITPQKDKDFDLTQVERRTGVAKGKVIWIEGTVVDTNGHGIEDASVEIWQANAAGRYRHPHDPSTAPLDPNFQGWAIVPSGKEGQFRFKTIMPGSYPAAKDWIRPPHIHFKVSKRAYVELITQMYFPGHPLNEKDLLLLRKWDEEQKRMIAEQINLDPDPETYRYRIVMQQA